MKGNFLQFLGLAKGAGKVLEGYNKCEGNLKDNKIHLIILSEDASQNTLNKFMKYGHKYNINVIIKHSKEELGRAVGLSQVKVLGITDKNMSKKLESM